MLVIHCCGLVELLACARIFHPIYSNSLILERVGLLLSIMRLAVTIAGNMRTDCAATLAQLGAGRVRLHTNPTNMTCACRPVIASPFYLSKPPRQMTSVPIMLL